MKSSLRAIGAAFVLAAVVSSCTERATEANAPAVVAGAEHLGVVLVAGSTRVELDLARNDHLFAPGFVPQVWEAGALRPARPNEVVPRQGCHYQGRARSQDGVMGIAAVQTCAGDGMLQGLVQLGSDWISVERSGGRMRGTLIHDEALTPLGDVRLEPAAPQRTGALRQALSTPTKFAELVALSDPAAFALHHTETLQEVADSVNAADALFRNGQLAPVVQLSLRRHVSFITQAPWSPTPPVDPTVQLNLMVSWLAGAGAPFNGDEVVLFSGLPLTPPTLGVAFVRGVCRNGFNVSAMGEPLVDSPATGFRGMVLAHEMGHAFSLTHVAGPPSIMAASTSELTYATQWAASSAAEFSNFFNTYYGVAGQNPACLEVDGGSVPWGCGDGVVGALEQCDCGASNCAAVDPCCNGATCTFISGATCSRQDPCCNPATCLPRAAGTSCRAAGSCSGGAACNGISTQCPTGALPNGTACVEVVGSPGQCFDARCVSLAYQCWQIPTIFPPGSPQVGDAGCQRLWCSTTDGGSLNVSASTIPRDGTSCGSGLQCLDTRCVATSALPVDQCPLDALKLVPGQCGCGVVDVDTDLDGTADCVDQCPVHSGKVAPGVCGCAVADADTDSDGTLNCLEQCPTDPSKTAPGVCGCGVSEVDTDLDGTLDCLEECPADPGKTAAGVCGCGVSEVDTDSDGTPDCNDACPADPAATAAPCPPPPKPSGCGCNSTAGLPELALVAVGLVLTRRRGRLRRARLQ